MAGTSRRVLGNLPAEVTSFVNRRNEVAQITRLLSTAWLVTLTGVAGVGKTRLALQAAARLQRAFADGVWLVELVHVRDDALVAHTVAHALGLRDSTEGDPLVALSEFLHDRRQLLVLDNCEHLIEACAALAHSLLTGAGGLRILATSREALRVTGEHLAPVAPLLVPERNGPRPAGPRPFRNEPNPAAVELFVQRARAAVPSFAVSERNRAHVLDLCRRLDGIPLAIELAAARLRSLSVEQLRSRLDDRFIMLNAGPRGPFPHQRTLRAAVDWSYELCGPAERTLWARTSVFAGTVDLESVEEVCAGDGVAVTDVIGVLDGLVGKSILIRAEQSDATVYQMLDTLREYGLARLRGAGGQQRVAQAHADRYLRLAEEAEREWFGPRQDQCFAWVRREHANLRSALSFYLAAGQTEAALRLGAALWFHWVFSGRVAEGRLWLERALARPEAPPRARAGALCACALLVSQQGELDDSARLAEESRELADRAGDPLTVARAVARLAIVANYRREPDRVEMLLADALPRYAALGESDSAYVVMALLTLAATKLVLGDLAAAAELCRRCAASCRSRGDTILLANALAFLAQGAWLAGRPAEALDHARDALRLRGAATPAHTLAQLIEFLAWFAAATGEAERAAVLLGAAGQVWRGFGLQRTLRAPLFRDRHATCAAQARRSLGETAFDAAFRRGSIFTLDETVDYAIGRPGRAPTTAGPPGAADLLTRREREVADLIADGLSNREIAGRLVLSQRTVDSHVAHILAKFGFISRAQIAGWVIRGRGTN